MSDLFVEGGKRFGLALVFVSASMLAVLLPIAAVNAQTFSRVWALSLDPSDGVIPSSVIDSSAGFAYFGIADRSYGQGSVLKIRLSDFSRAGRLMLNPGEIGTTAVIDSAAGFAYFGTQSNIVKIRLSNFTRVGSISLNPNEYNGGFSDSAVLDSVGGFAYFSTGGCTNPPPWITYQSCAVSSVVKVSLSDFTRVSALSPNGGGDWDYSSIIDPLRGFAYFWTNSSPGVIAKVRLSDFTRVGSITLNYSESGLNTAVIDSPGGFVYFGSGGFPSEIIKVEIAPPIILFHPPTLFDQFVWWAPYLSIATGVALIVGVIIIHLKGNRYLTKTEFVWHDMWTCTPRFRLILGRTLGNHLSSTFNGS